MYCSMVLFKCDELHCVIKWTNVNCCFLCQDGRYGCGRFDLWPLRMWSLKNYGNPDSIPVVICTSHWKQWKRASEPCFNATVSFTSQPSHAAVHSKTLSTSFLPHDHTQEMHKLKAMAHKYVSDISVILAENKLLVHVAFSALTLLVWRQERHPACKKMGGWWRWALVSPDGVAPSWMVGVSASVNLRLHHKVQKFSSGIGSPGWSRKKCRKMVVCMCVCVCVCVWYTLRTAKWISTATQPKTVSTF